MMDGFNPLVMAKLNEVLLLRSIYVYSNDHRYRLLLLVLLFISLYRVRFVYWPTHERIAIKTINPFLWSMPCDFNQHPISIYSVHVYLSVCLPACCVSTRH